MSVKDTSSGQACPTKPWMTSSGYFWLQMHSLEGERMSAAKSLPSWPGPWGFAPRSSSPAHMGVMAQKLSNWNQCKGKAWNLGKAVHSCSELQSRLSTFADDGPRHIGRAFTREAKNRRPNGGVWPGRTFLRGKIYISQVWKFFGTSVSPHVLCWSEERPSFSSAGQTVVLFKYLILDATSDTVLTAVSINYLFLVHHISHPPLLKHWLEDTKSRQLKGTP